MGATAGLEKFSTVLYLSVVFPINGNTGYILKYNPKATIDTTNNI